MKVRALEKGFDNLCVREPGDVFEMPDDVFEDKRNPERKEADKKEGREFEPPKWFEAVDNDGRPLHKGKTPPERQAQLQADAQHAQSMKRQGLSTEPVPGQGPRPNPQPHTAVDRQAVKDEAAAEARHQGKSGKDLV